MSRKRVEAGFIVTALATVAGCATQGYELPGLPSQGQGYHSPYGSYGPGYYGYGRGPMSYYGYPGYGQGYYAYGPYDYLGGPYPYGYGAGSGYYPYPGYFLPCADRNHNGRCDKQPGHDGDGEHQDGGGHGDQHHGGHGNGNGNGNGPGHGSGNDGRPRDGTQASPPPIKPYTPKRDPQPGAQPKRSEPRRVELAPQEPRVRAAPTTRDDDAPRPKQD